MACCRAIAAINNLGLAYKSPAKQFCIFFAAHRPNKLKIRSCARIFSSQENPSSEFNRRSKVHYRLLKSVQLDVSITSEDEDEMGEGFFEAIEELERMAREPSDVLEEMNDKLTARELQLVLVYFAQEGRDSWCALEVFEWLKKENRVDKETMELMVSIMCTWVKKLIQGKNKVEDVVDLLVDMDCVGLKTSFSMIEKVISLYWEAGEKEATVSFVKEVLRRGIATSGGDRDGNKGGPAGYLAWKMMHRGPDWGGLYQNGDCYLAHQRLAIIDPASGDQPLFNEDKKIVVTVNGEIYNHEELRRLLPNHKFRTGSDCDVIAHLYEEYGENFVDMLDGMFSFVLLDTRDNSFLAARDAFGITSLYIGWGLDGSVWISSELKGLHDECEHFEAFPPGNLYSSKIGGFKRWYNPPWFSEAIPSTPYDPLVLRRAFENAVIKRLMTDVPFGVLLSGGLDSSLVASVTSRYLAGTKAAKQWGAQLHSFCVGLEGSPDLKAAREVADYLGTVHHEFHFTVQDGIDAIEDVIYHIETYDVTTIRASTPMFLMSRKIKSLGVKMVISGEGSDEIFGGYLYFHKAPNKEELHRETCHKIKALHQYDCLRANKATSAWGLEAQVPFLDKEFVNVAMSIDPEWKMIKPEQGHIEKWILRRAFHDEEHPYLPKHILYRQKEQFSDGVGYSWIDGLKAHADQHVNDKMMLNAAHIFSHNTPMTKEAYYYRMIFERFFPQNSATLTVPRGASVACSTAKAVEWDASWSKNLDPSGRAAIGVHNSAYEKHFSSVANGNLKSKIMDNVPLGMGVAASELTIRS